MAATLQRQILSPKYRPHLRLFAAFASGTKSKTIDNEVTHTGQKFDENDYRLARFIGREKKVNTQFAIDLIDAVPPKPVKDHVVWCDGGGGALGHPKVYINLDKPGPKACGYCGLRFVLEDHHH